MRPWIIIVLMLAWASSLYGVGSWQRADGFKEAETYSARAGYSEHQLGLAVDIVNGKWNYLSEGDKEYTWLINNSYKYGFILRYPHESEYITGYVFEDLNRNGIKDNKVSFKKPFSLLLGQTSYEIQGDPKYMK